VKLVCYLLSVYGIAYRSFCSIALVFMVSDHIYVKYFKDLALLTHQLSEPRFETLVLTKDKVTQ